MPHLQPQSAQQLIVVFLCRFFCRFLLSFYFRKKTTTHAPDQEWRSPVRPGRAWPWQRRLGPRWATRCVRAPEPPGVHWKERIPVRQGQDPNQTCSDVHCVCRVSEITSQVKSSQGGRYFLGKVCFLYEETHKAMVSVEESSVARKRVWTYERTPQGTSAATRPLHAHRREAMEQIAIRT